MKESFNADDSSVEAQPNSYDEDELRTKRSDSAKSSEQRTDKVAFHKVKPDVKSSGSSESSEESKESDESNEKIGSKNSSERNKNGSDISKTSNDGSKHNDKSSSNVKDIAIVPVNTSESEAVKQ